MSLTAGKRSNASFAHENDHAKFMHGLDWFIVMLLNRRFMKIVKLLDVGSLANQINPVLSGFNCSVVEEQQT